MGSERLQKRAARDHWSDTKLQRALREVEDDWTGLDPQVLQAIAAVAETGEPVSLFLYWNGKGSRPDVRQVREFDPNSFRLDPSTVAENQLEVVRL